MIDEAFLNALIAAGGPVIAVGVSTFINWRATQQAAKRLLATSHDTKMKLSEIAETTAGTHTIVNSQRTVMIDQIEGMRSEISRLQARIDEMKK